MANDAIIFNRKRVRQHRERAAARLGEHDFLLHEMASRLGDRLPDVTRTFPLALDLGAHHGLLTRYIPPQSGITTWVQADMSLPMLGGCKGLRVVADEEFNPFAANTFDLAMSAASLHWVNDLPGALIQINRILKPDGLFLAMVPGGETLKELRQSFEHAEMQITGGISPRISPFIDVKDAGALLQRAGFVLPVTDSEILTVIYEHPIRLLHDLRGMGQANALMTSAKHATRRAVIFSALDYYQQHFADADGRVRATFEIVTLTGWKPDGKPQ